MATDSSSSTPATFATSWPSTKPISMVIDHTDHLATPRRYEHWATPKRATSRSPDVIGSAE